MTYQQARSKLQYQLDKLHSSLESYQLAQNPSPYYIASQQKIITAISNFMDAAEHEIHINTILTNQADELQRLKSELDTKNILIKKLALIVLLSKITFPTIGQPLEHLYKMYLSQQDPDNPHVWDDTTSADEIIVTLPVI